MPHTAPPLLPLFLKTLSLLLHASGPNTLALPLLTSEFWPLLLSLRAPALDPQTLEAVLFGLLTVLEVNAAQRRRVAEEHARELLETKGWVEGVLRGGAEGKVSVLCAGVLGAVGEVLGEWERVLVGEVGGWL